MLDFDRMREEIGIPAGEPILEYLDAVGDDALRARADAVLERHEREAAEASELNPGAQALLDWLDARRVGRAVVTRNTLENALAVVRKHDLGFVPDVIVSRGCARPKPHPEALLIAAERLGTDPTAMMMIGDFRFDIEAGRAAGMRTALLTNGAVPDYADLADHVVARLDALIGVLEGDEG